LFKGEKMTVTTLENGQISDAFSFETAYGRFSDALVMTPDEYAALTTEDIDTLKQARLDRWLAIFIPQDAV
jgi:hypothetical protein